MLFKNKKRKLPRPFITLKMDGRIIHEVTHSRFFWVFINSELNWSYHCNHISTKVAKGVGILSKLRKYVNNKTLTTMYYSFIYPYFNYCIEVWGKTYDIYLNKLWLLQKRAIRIISYSDYLAHTEALFKELKILPIKKVYVFSVAQFMFKYNRQLLPNIFDNMFTMNAFLHTYYTRQRNV